jgi:hypothetical protein
MFNGGTDVVKLSTAGMNQLYRVCWVVILGAAIGILSIALLPWARAGTVPPSSGLSAGRMIWIGGFGTHLQSRWTAERHARIDVIAMDGHHACRLHFNGKHNNLWSLHSKAFNLTHGPGEKLPGNRARIVWSWQPAGLQSRNKHSQGAVLQVAFFSGAPTANGHQTGRFLGQFSASTGLSFINQGKTVANTALRRHSTSYHVPSRAKSMVVAVGASPHVTGAVILGAIKVGYAGPSLRQSVTLPTIPRPYPTVQPKMPPPARTLWVADVSHEPSDVQRLLVTLQGLVNRHKPQIYLIWTHSDWFWLRELKRQHSITGWRVIKHPLSLVAHFKSFIKGAVVPDPAIFDSPDIACDIGAIDDLLVATPQLARRLHLPVRVDLRGKFSNDAAALRYLRKKLLPKMNPYLMCCLDPAILGRGGVDQLIAAKGPIFWVTGRSAQQLPGADMYAEKSQIKKLLAQTPFGAVVRGFWWCGPGSGLGEGPGVALASQYGKLTVVSDYTRNFSVFSGVRLSSLRQTFLPAPRYNQHKVYIALTVSDGDNLCTWQSYFRRWFQSPYLGKFAISWGMGPTLIDVAPTIARWYFRHARPNNEFLCDVSGVGYFYPPVWARRLSDRRQAFNRVYRWTWRYMKRLDMPTLRLFLGSARGQAQERRVIAAVGRAMPQLSFLMPDYGYSGEKRYSQLTYTLPTGQSVFRAATNSSFGPHWTVHDMVRQIHHWVGHRRSAFLNVFVWNWGASMRKLYQLTKTLGPRYVEVTPTQLNTLYRDARR